MAINPVFLSPHNLKKRSLSDGYCIFVEQLRTLQEFHTGNEILENLTFEPLNLTFELWILLYVTLVK